MALRELPSTLCRQITRCRRPMIAATAQHSRRFTSAGAAPSQDVAAELQDLETQSSFTTSDYPKEKIEAFNPEKRAQGRKLQLPASRYDLNCCQNGGLQPVLILPDTSIDPQDTIEDPFILTNLHHHPILLLEFSFPAPSHERASSRPTSPPSPPTS